MFIVNVGDSMVVLGCVNLKSRQAKKPYMDAVVLTKQHHLEDREERKWIESLGEIISNNRIWCNLKSDVAPDATNKDRDTETRWISLNMSRSLGDF